MNPGEWIALCGVVGGLVLQFLIGAYFFGRIDESVRGMRSRLDGVDQRFILMEGRQNGYGERLAALESQRN